MYITAADYTQYTGDAVPENFASIAVMADAIIDARTCYKYVGRNISSLPTYISGTLKQCAAYQVQYIAMQGGVDGVNDSASGSVTVGRFSVGRDGTGSSVPTISPAASALLPILAAYARGL